MPTLSKLLPRLACIPRVFIMQNSHAVTNRYPWVVKRRYQYRLCPRSVDGHEVELNEECFQKMPLDFVGNSSLRWGGEGGHRIYFNTTERGWEARGVEGGIWRKNPLPRGPWSWQAYGPSFEPVCDEPAVCANGQSRNPGGISPCKCSGSGVCALPGRIESNCADMPQMEVVDTVRIPAGLTSGEYVLGYAQPLPLMHASAASVAA
jgi:hypothetical protein